MPCRDEREKKTMTSGYEIDIGLNPPSCLPTWLDRSNLKDMTCIGDQWRKYIDTRTGEVHDGTLYYRRMIEAMAKTGESSERC